MIFNKSSQNLFFRFCIFLATVFGLGKIFRHYGPGTVGSLVGLGIYWFLYWIQTPLSVLLLLILIFIPLAVFSAHLYENQGTGDSKVTKDAPEVIIDEVLGMMIALAGLPLTPQTLVISFILFRLLDILKPFPISYLDRHIPGGLGIVVDDVAAALVTNLILQVVYTKTSWLGVQLLTIGLAPFPFWNIESFLGWHL